MLTRGIRNKNDWLLVIWACNNNSYSFSLSHLRDQLVFYEKYFSLFLSDSDSSQKWLIMAYFYTCSAARHRHVVAYFYVASTYTRPYASCCVALHCIASHRMWFDWDCEEGIRVVNEIAHDQAHCCMLTCARCLNWSEYMHCVAWKNSEKVSSQHRCL